MSIEIMIYAYLFICTAMIIFNIVTAVFFKHKARNTVRTSEKFCLMVNMQLTKIQMGEHCDTVHKKYMRKKLKKIGNMLAFDKMLETTYIEKPERVKQYLTEMEGVFIALLVNYCGKDRIEETYFPYIIKKYRLLSERTIPTIEETLLGLLDEPSIYCRENALQALYTTGNCERVIEAIRKIDRSDLYFNGKILSDGLLNFSGNTEKLIDEIIADFEIFSDEMKVTLMNFMRFSTPNRREFFYSLLCDESKNDEIHYCAIRYLGKYKFEKSYDKLCKLAKKEEAKKWEYSAIASTALAIYPSEQTVDILKNNLYSKSWYVRFNSAESLKKLGITYSFLADVIDGNDRYASEILRYMLEKNETERRSVVV